MAKWRLIELCKFRGVGGRGGQKEIKKVKVR